VYVSVCIVWCSLIPTLGANLVSLSNLSRAPRLIDLALGIFYMTGDDEDDDEMSLLIEEEEIPDVRYCGGGVRSKL
jgi:hypothetical protein